MLSGAMLRHPYKYNNDRALEKFNFFFSYKIQVFVQGPIKIVRLKV